jgi:hypothetical protein
MGWKDGFALAEATLETLFISLPGNNAVGKSVNSQYTCRKIAHSN